MPCLRLAGHMPEPACPQRGDLSWAHPLTGTGDRAAERSREAEVGLEAGRTVAQAVQPPDPLLMGYVGCWEG